MKNYIDKYGLYHDKPVINKEPSSNNGWVYTAYAKRLGFKIKSDFDYIDLFYDCKRNSGDFISNRLPGKYEPPISRDEVIGMNSIGVNVFRELFLTNYNMSKIDIDSFSYIYSIKLLWKIRKKHRNYVWENKLYQAYKLAFKLLPHDIYYIKKTSYIKTSILEWLWFQAYAILTILQKNISAKNVLWLQLKDLNSVFWIKFINQKENFKVYFIEDHIFNKGEN